MATTINTMLTGASPTSNGDGSIAGAMSGVNDGALTGDLPPQPKAFVPDFHPEEISQIAEKLRQAAGLPKEPTGQVNVS